MEMPWWVEVLNMAQEWGRPPWEIVGGSDFIWILRWRAYHEEVNRAQRKKYKNG